MISYHQATRGHTHPEIAGSQRMAKEANKEKQDQVRSRRQQFDIGGREPSCAIGRLKSQRRSPFTICRERLPTAWRAVSSRVNNRQGSTIRLCGNLRARAALSLTPLGRRICCYVGISVTKEGNFAPGVWNISALPNMMVGEDAMNGIGIGTSVGLGATIGLGLVAPGAQLEEYAATCAFFGIWSGLLFEVYRFALGWKHPFAR
jgi:hypothetical protein